MKQQVGGCVAAIDLVCVNMAHEWFLDAQEVAQQDLDFVEPVENWEEYAGQQLVVCTRVDGVLMSFAGERFWARWEHYDVEVVDALVMEVAQLDEPHAPQMAVDEWVVAVNEYYAARHAQTDAAMAEEGRCGEYEEDIEEPVEVYSQFAEERVVHYFASKQIDEGRTWK